MIKKILWGTALFLGAVFFVAVTVNHLLPKPTVSVLMSTYNRARLLPAAIDSVLNQTYTDFELIIINDGSTDDTAQVLQEYADADSRVRVFTNHKNKGLIESLNYGIKKCRGKYIARIDDDDEMFPERLAKQVAQITAAPQTALVTSAYIHHNRETKQESVIGCFSNDRLKAEILFANRINHATVLLNKDFLNKHHIRYSRAYPDAEDYDFWRQILVKGGSVVCIPEPLTAYKRAADNAPEFYTTQWRSVLKIQEKFLDIFFDRKDRVNRNNLCQKWPLFLERNETIGWTSAQNLKALEPEICPEHFEPFFKIISKDGFGDILLYQEKGGNRLYRKKHRRDMATLVTQTKNKLVVDWDDRGREEFSCQKNVCSSVVSTR